MGKRQHSLYRRLRTAEPRARWERIGTWSYHRAGAVRVYQTQLIGNAVGQIEPEYEYRIRPIGKGEQG